MARKRRIVTCVCCGKPGALYGRGLKAACYARNAKAGTLDRFPKLGRAVNPRPERICECGTKYRSKHDRCRDCRLSEGVEDNIEDDDEDMSTGPGEWVLDMRERILKFVPECPDCGQLANPKSTCPSCLVWAEKDAVKASWRRPLTERKAG